MICIIQNTLEETTTGIKVLNAEVLADLQRIPDQVVATRAYGLTNSLEKDEDVELLSLTSQCCFMGW